MAIVNYNSSGLFLYDTDPPGAAGLRINSNFKALANGTAVLRLGELTVAGDSYISGGHALWMAAEGATSGGGFIYMLGGSLDTGGGPIEMGGGAVSNVGTLSFGVFGGVSILVDPVTSTVTFDNGGDFLMTISGDSSIITIGTLVVNSGATFAASVFSSTATFDNNATFSSAVSFSSPLAKLLVPLFDHNADVSSTSTNGTENDLYTDTLAAGQFVVDKNKVFAEYGLSVVSSATATRRIQAYVGGTKVLDSGTLTFTSTGTVRIWITIIRVSASVLRVMAEFDATGLTLQPLVQYTSVTGLTLANTQIVKITGIAAGTGAASGDIVAKVGVITAMAAA